MHRSVRTPLALALAAAALAPTQAHALRPGEASAALRECRTGAQAVQRYAVYRGDAKALRGTTRIWMRFDLFDERGRKLTSVAGPALSSWTKSGPKPARFTFDKTAQFTDPGTFRAVVRVRWYKGSRLQKQVTRRTAGCVQPDRRADLAVASVRVRPGVAGSQQHEVTVRNAGATDAPAFDVRLRAGDAEPAQQTVAGLAAGESVVLRFTAPACEAGERVSVLLDPEDRVDEPDRELNARSTSCSP